MKHVNEKDINEEIKWAQINTDILHSLQNPRMAYWVAVAACMSLASSLE